MIMPHHKKIKIPRGIKRYVRRRKAEIRKSRRADENIREKFFGLYKQLGYPKK